MDLIIGAGITGLSYAAFSKRNDYLIIEATDSVGGYCKTTKRNGFVWDYSGHFFHFVNKEIEQFIAYGIDAQQLISVEKQTQIRFKDRLVDYPFQKNIHQLPQQDFIDCLYDLFINDHTEYNNFEEMLYCKFGKSIAEKFLIPYNEKLYACNLNTLDKDAMGRFFPYAEKMDIIKNFRKQDNNTYNASFVYPKGGAIEYVNSLMQHIDNQKIMLNTKVVAIDSSNKVATLSNGQSVHYDNLISTIPFPQLLQLTGTNYDADIYSCNQVVVFNLGFDKQGLDTRNHWIYFPEKDYVFYRVGFYSNILSQDRLSLYVEVGFDENATPDTNKLLQQVLNDLVKAQIIDNTHALVDHETIIMNPAYVHINEHSLADVSSKKMQLAQSDIYSIGRYGSWTYCSIEDNIKEAKLLAEQL